MFSTCSNDLYHLPEIPTQSFYELFKSGLTADKFVRLSANVASDSNEAFKDMINKGILVPVK